MSNNPKHTTKDFDPEVLGLFDQFVHGDINRRSFLIGAAKFAVGGLTAVGLLEALSPKFAYAPPLDKLVNIKSPLLMHFAEKDGRVNVSWPPYENALKAAGIQYESYVYDGTQHGFNNDTTPRYDEAAAKLAWQRTVTFFNAHLRS